MRRRQEIMTPGRIVKILILTLLFILAISPILIGRYVDSKRSEWETDRNFYGKDIKLNNIKVQKNSAQEIIYSVKKFKKNKANGKVNYYLEYKTEGSAYDDSDINSEKLQVSHKDYQKYVANSDEITMYMKKAVFEYQSKQGKINAVITSNVISFEPQTYNKKELENIKKKLWKQCQDKAFANNCDEKNMDQRCINKKGTSVCTKFSFLDKATNSYYVVKGQSLIKPGKYDRLYPDAKMYLPDGHATYNTTDKILNAISHLYYIYYSATKADIIYYIFLLIMVFAFPVTKLVDDIRSDIELEKFEKEHGLSDIGCGCHKR